MLTFVVWATVCCGVQFGLIPWHRTFLTEVMCGDAVCSDLEGVCGQLCQILWARKFSLVLWTALTFVGLYYWDHCDVCFVCRRYLKRPATTTESEGRGARVPAQQSSGRGTKQVYVTVEIRDGNLVAKVTRGVEETNKWSFIHQQVLWTPSELYSLWVLSRCDLSNVETHGNASVNTDEIRAKVRSLVLPCLIRAFFHTLLSVYTLFLLYQIWV